MNRYLGLDRSFLWAMRGLMRLFVRPGVAPADALERLSDAQVQAEALAALNRMYPASLSS